jgi:hypothetical protein
VRRRKNTQHRSSNQEKAETVIVITVDFRAKKTTKDKRSIVL